MIFYILPVFSLIFACLAAPTAFLIPVFWVLYTLILVVLQFLGSVLLGKNVQEVLVKKERYLIRELRDDTIFLYDYDADMWPIPVSYIAETRSDSKISAPYVEIEYYGMKPWRRFFLLDLYTRKQRIILYKDET